MTTPYQTLYRKYRSQTFGDLVGQEVVSRALRGAVEKDRVAHAYLFSGTRGTGKTSTARLLAKALNCTSRPAGAAEPCNACESCISMTAGSALDLIEIDAASNRGIDEIRDLREKVHLSPALGPKKIYIVDEAHMLTTDAFNALLKTLEEPPEHVVFILCTTEAQKVPATVLGRCLHFVFRRLNEEEIVARLRHIAAAEGIAVEDAVLELVARAAQGSMRDAVGLLDQLVPLASGPIGLEAARELLQMADPAVVGRLLDLVLDGRAREALDLLGTIYAAGAEYRSVVRGLMEAARDRLVAAVEKRDAVLRARLSEVLDALVHLDGEVRRHGEPRFLVEATLVRLAAAGAPAGAAQVVQAPVVEAPVVAVAPPIAAPPPAPVEATLPTEAPPPAPEAPRAAPDGELEAGWRSVLDQLKPNVRAVFREARPELQDGTLVLAFRYAWHHKNAPAHIPSLQPLVSAWLGEGVVIELREEAGDAAAVAADRGSPADPRGPAPAPEEHPLVQEAIRKLEGKVTRVRES